MIIIGGINNLFNHAGLRTFFVHTRKLLGALALLALLSRVAPSVWFGRGLLVSLLGAAGQWWCFACIMTSKELAVNGPYRFVRNPMYLTRYVLILGLLLTLNPSLPWRWTVPLLFTVIYGFFMHNRVRREERKLTPIFGESYQRYLRDVPRFVPSFKAFPGGKTCCWNPEAFRRNHGARNMIVILLGYAFAYLAVYHLMPGLGGTGLPAAGPG